MAEINEIVSKSAIDDIINLNEAFLKLEKNIAGVLNNSQKLNDQLNKTAQSTATTEQKAKEYNTILEETAANQKELNAQQKQLESTQVKLSTVQSSVNEQLIRYKKQLAEENELLKQNSILTDKNSGTLEKAAAYNKILEIEKRKLDLTNKEGVKRLKEINAQQDKNNELIASSSNKLQAQKINIGNYKSAIQELGQQFINGEITAGQMSKGILQVGKAMFTVFITNPILLAIGAIVGALAGLVAIFKSTDAGATALEGVFKGLKNIVDILVDRLGALIRLDFKSAFGGMGKQVKEAAKAGWEYAQAMDGINDREVASLNRREKLKKQYEELYTLSKDESLSRQEQIKYADEALKIAEELNSIEIGFLKERNQAELNNLASKLNNSKLSQEEKRKELESWLAVDDKELFALMEKDAAFKEFYDKNEDAFQTLQKTKADEVAKEGELIKETRRLQTALFSDRKKLDDEARAAAKKRSDDLKKQMDETLSFTAKADELNKKRQESEKELNDFIEEQSFDIVEVKENEAALIDAIIENTRKNAEIKYRQQVLLIKSTSKTEEEAAKRIAALDESNIQGTINNISRQLEASDISAERRLELETQLAEAQMNLDDAVFERKKSNEEKAAELRKAAFEGTMQVANALFDFMGSRYNDELTLLEQKNQQGLLSDKEYAKQKAEIEIKQAKLAKLQGIFDATINTAKAITSALTVAPPAGAILAVAAGITGGLQIASILSQPLPTIPAFAEGTKNAPSFGLAGEAGTELGITKTGESILFDKPTIFKGEKFKGMHIYSNPELEAMKAMNQFNYTSDSTAIVQKLDSLEKAIQNKPVFIFDKEHNIVGKKIGNYTEKYVNRLKFGE